MVADDDEGADHDEEPQPLDLLHDRNGAKEPSECPHAVRTNGTSNELEGGSGEDADCFGAKTGVLAWDDVYLCLCEKWRSEMKINYGLSRIIVDGEELDG